MDELHAATLDIRSTADRWGGRLGLLLAAMSALLPDLRPSDHVGTSARLEVG